MTIHIPGTNQEVFDRVCAHLARQGKKAYIGGSCAYRTPEGLKCAIGGLLTDAECAVLDALDDSSIRAILRRGVATAEADLELLSDLQHAHDDTNHDDTNHVETLRERLSNIAIEYNLTWIAADQITEWLV